jgi:hypothetical protein
MMSAMSRLTTLAEARSLTDGRFEQRAAKALSDQTNLQVIVAWGGLSKISKDEEMKRITNSLETQFGDSRVHDMYIPEGSHGMCDDISLNALIVIQALRNHSQNPSS